ncbi:hypothetical protein ACWGCP_32520, partial [Streptomyces niveus]
VLSSDARSSGAALAGGEPARGGSASGPAQLLTAHVIRVMVTLRVTVSRKARLGPRRRRRRR